MNRFKPIGLVGPLILVVLCVLAMILNSIALIAGAVLFLGLSVWALENS